MKYWIEYKAPADEYDDKLWEELTESEFSEICTAQGDYAPDIYFIQLTEPSLVIRNKS
jgi:hypothetical protein